MAESVLSQGCTTVQYQVGYARKLDTAGQPYMAGSSDLGRRYCTRAGAKEFIPTSKGRGLTGGSSTLGCGQLHGLARECSGSEDQTARLPLKDLRARTEYATQYQSCGIQHGPGSGQCVARWPVILSFSIFRTSCHKRHYPSRGTLWTDPRWTYRGGGPVPAAAER